MAYDRILTRLVNTPLALAESKFQIIHENVILKLIAGEGLSKDVNPTPHTNIKLISQTSDFPIIEVFDSLASKGGAGDSGYTSYQSIINQAVNYANAGHKTIGFYFDSPGGEFTGLYNAASTLKNLSTIYGIKLIGFTDGLACSACYGLASAMDEFYATKDAFIGSIGVIGTLVDLSSRDKAQGINYLIVRSKSEKALYNPHEVFSQEVINNFTNHIQMCDTIFNELVVSNKPILNLEQVIGFNGKAFFAEEALKLGLITGVVDSIQAVLEDKFSKTITNPTSISLQGITQMTLDEAKLQIASLTAEKSILEAKVKDMEISSKAAGIAEERARCVEIIKLSDTFGLKIDSVVKHISQGTSASVVKEVGEAIAEERSKTTANLSNINTSTDTNIGNNINTNTSKDGVLASGYTVGELLQAAYSY